MKWLYFAAFFVLGYAMAIGIGAYHLSKALLTAEALKADAAAGS